VLALGLAYKPNVDDERESPSYRIMELLKQRGADVSYYDPYVPVIRPTREHPQWAGTKSIPRDRAAVAGVEAVIIGTSHACVNYQELADWAQWIVDTRNGVGCVQSPGGRLWKA
jgi:UDP-N-acetyl-D-glucosamine dehydrogenase